VTPLHLGQLHAYEHLLVWGLAFGPFIVLGVVVAWIRRRDTAAELATTASDSPPGSQDEPTSHA
jgi:hypothetical protein